MDPALLRNVEDEVIPRSFSEAELQKPVGILHFFGVSIETLRVYPQPFGPLGMRGLLHSL